MATLSGGEWVFLGHEIYVGWTIPGCVTFVCGFESAERACELDYVSMSEVMFWGLV